MTAEQYQYWQSTAAREYEPNSDELGNCPNCADLVTREVVYRFNGRTSLAHYYWACDTCGYTHHGHDIPPLD